MPRWSSPAARPGRTRLLHLIDQLEIAGLCLAGLALGTSHEALAVRLDVRDALGEYPLAEGVDGSVLGLRLSDCVFERPHLGGGPRLRLAGFEPGCQALRVLGVCSLAGRPRRSTSPALRHSWRRSSSARRSSISRSSGQRFRRGEMRARKLCSCPASRWKFGSWRGSGFGIESAAFFAIFALPSAMSVQRRQLLARHCHAFAMSRLSASDACEESQEGPYRDSPISSSFQCSYRRCDPRRRRQS
jgi:hypothetical protein